MIIGGRGGGPGGDRGGKVKKALDGVEKNGRTLKVRFSPHQGAVKVTNLGKFLIAQKSSFYREVTV